MVPGPVQRSRKSQGSGSWPEKANGDDEKAPERSGALSVSKAGNSDAKRAIQMRNGQSGMSPSNPDGGPVGSSWPGYCRPAFVLPSSCWNPGRRLDPHFSFFGDYSFGDYSFAESSRSSSSSFASRCRSGLSGRNSSKRTSAFSSDSSVISALLNRLRKLR